MVHLVKCIILVNLHSDWEEGEGEGYRDLGRLLIEGEAFFRRGAEL